MKTRSKFPLFLRFALFSGLFIVIIASLALNTILALTAVDRNTLELEQKWLNGTALLGEIDHGIAAYRLTETYRALVPDPGSRALAEALAAAQGGAITALEARYRAQLGPELPAADFAAFDTAWKQYQAGHDAWLKSDPQGLNNDPAIYGSPLDVRYRTADAAISQLITVHHNAAHARGQAINRIAHRTILAACAIAAAAIGLAIMLVLGIRQQILQPLATITTALSELAAGHHNIQIPEMHRSDEIGQIAAACEAFRLNVLALDRAHAETREAKEQANLQARHDALTGLPNRRVFTAELHTAIARAQAGSATYSLFLLDLDEFKLVNDLQGHDVGDAVLCEVSRRLEKVLRSNDTVARLGGDEFAIIAEGDAELPAHLDQAMRLASRLIAEIHQPIAACGNKINIGASIGIAICRADARDVSTLLRSADIAMYRAKQSGRNTFRFFEQSMDDEMRAQETLEKDLIRAVAERQIKPHYQPLIDIAENRIRGFEALARWQHPQHGFIPPAEFLPLVEQLGLMTELTNAILRQACRDARQWPADIRVSVNVSPSELRDPHLPERILAILAEENLPPTRLEIEITETALIRDVEAAKKTLNPLQAAGITICLDDFGTGYSSLFHLREMKFDKVKIDRSFIQSMQGNSGSEKIVDAILNLAQSLDLPTVAEGIENPATRLLLASMGCKYGQGFYFGKPTTAAEAGALLKTGISLPASAVMYPANSVEASSVGASPKTPPRGSAPWIPAGA